MTTTFEQKMKTTKICMSVMINFITFESRALKGLRTTLDDQKNSPFKVHQSKSMITLRSTCRLLCCSIRYYVLFVCINKGYLSTYAQVDLTTRFQKRIDLLDKMPRGKRKVVETVAEPVEDEEQEDNTSDEPDAKRLKATVTVTSEAGPSADSHIDLTKSIRENLLLPLTLTEEVQDVKQHRSYEWEKPLRNIAEYLMNEVVLCVRNDTGVITRFRLAEIEFYATTKNREHMHEDPFSHCHPLQASAGVWYFHQSLSKTNDDNYKGGSYKGMDFTFGFNDDGGKHKSYGGILIRSMEELKPNDTRASFVDGPSKTCDAMLEKAGCSSIHELVSKRFPSAKQTGGIHLPIEKPDGHDEYPLYLTRHTLNHEPVLASSRVGMSLKQNTLHDARARFVVKPYRYFIHADTIKKGKNQMVVSLYDKMVRETLGDEEDISKLSKNDKTRIVNEVCKKLGAGKTHADKYIKQYELGREKAVKLKQDGKLDLNADMKQLFGKNLNSDELCKMHGLLYKFL
jgi:hypothetical protein